MIGQNIQNDIHIPAHARMNDFGAGFQYTEAVSRPGQLVAPNLRNVPRAGMNNINKVFAIQVNQNVPRPNTTPISSIKSSYTFLPIGNTNAANPR